MQELLAKIDTKTITSAGGILLTAGSLFIIYQLAFSGIETITRAVEAHSNDTRNKDSELNITLKELKKAIDDNTKATANLQLYIGRDLR